LSQRAILTLQLSDQGQACYCKPPSNKRVQPTGWIGAILASGSRKKAFPVYVCRSFQPAADTQAVTRPVSFGRPHIGVAGSGAAVVGLAALL